jgi:hypothetical protein
MNAADFGRAVVERYLQVLTGLIRSHLNENESKGRAARVSTTLSAPGSLLVKDCRESLGTHYRLRLLCISPCGKTDTSSGLSTNVM